MEKKDLAYYSDVEFKVKSLPLQDEDYEDRDLIHEFEGRIVYTRVDDETGAEERKVLGHINGAKVDLGEAMNRKTHPWDVFDLDSGVAQYYGAFFSDGEFREELDIESLGDFLIIHEVRILPKYRGGYLGLLAVRRAMKTFGGGCALAAIKPFPLQFENKVTDNNQVEFDAAQKKLRDYWGLLGFKQCRDTEFYYFDLAYREPKLKIMSSKAHVLKGE